MTYDIITTRPNATDKTYAVTVYGSAVGHHNAVNDDDDAGPYLGGQRDNAYEIFRFPAPAGIPTDSSTASRRVRRVRVQARLIRGAIENESMLFAFRDGIAGWTNKAQTIRTSTGIWATLAAGWETIAPGGHSWAYFMGRQPQVQCTWKASSSGNVLRMTALYADWEIDDQPTVSTVTVSGNTVTNHPVIGWDYDDANGDLQVRAQVKVFSDAQYNAAGFAAATSTATWDSGELATSAETATVAADLVPNATYRPYVRAAQAWTGTPEGTLWWSDWAAGPSFTIQGTPPPTPTLTATGLADLPGYRAALTVDAPVNLLTADEAGFDAGSVGSWVRVLSGGSPTLATSTTRVLSGVASMAMTSTSTGSATAVISGNGDAVLGGRTYTGRASLRAGSVGRASRVELWWFSGGGGLLSTTLGSTTTTNTTGWTSISVTGTAPLNARTCALAVTVQSTASTEIHYVDQASLHVGSSTLWAPGGFRSTQAVVIERGDAVDPQRGPAANWVQPQIASGGSELRSTVGFRVDLATADVLTHEPVMATLPGGPDGCIHWAQRSGSVGTVGGGFNAGFTAGLGAGSGGVSGLLLLGQTPHTADTSGYIFPVAPGLSHTIAATLWRGSTAASVQLYIDWLAEDGRNVVSTGGSGTTVALTTTPTRYATTATAPSNARYARGVVLNIGATSTTDVYVTRVEFGLTSKVVAGAPAEGQPIEWIPVRDLSGSATPPVGEMVLAADWEIPAGRPVVYRAKTTAIAADGSETASVSSNYVPLYLDEPARNVLLDPFAPSAGAVVNIEPRWGETRARQAQTYYPLGRSADSISQADPIVLRDWLGGQDASLTLTTLSEAELYRLRQVLASSRPLLLRPFEGGATYVMVVEDESTSRIGFATFQIAVRTLGVARPS